ncbi:MAG: choice-of-anchor tandem repeat GloVer-containing protein [Pseudomonadota bacterium]
MLRSLLISTVAILSVGQGSAIARTQDANVISVTSLVIAAQNLPATPRGNLLLANDGNIYITGLTGGSNNIGAVARITPAGDGTSLHSFISGNDDGQSPYAGVMQASDNALYGTTYVGGDGNGGTVYRLTLDGTFTLLHSFKVSGKTDPHYPYTGLVQASDGNLYGTTLRGGADDKGTVFRITLAGVLTQIHDFTGDDGENPEGTLVVGSDGNLYGTTLQGGADGRGTVYRMSLDGAVTTLHSFAKLSAFSTAGVATNATGANPRAGLFLAADGNLYGTAYQGGPVGYGTVFRLDPAGVVTVVHAFAGPTSDGAFPLSTVSQDAAGNLYGTTERGGPLNQGGAWRIKPSGQFSLLHGFTSSIIDGASPYAGLLPLNGYLYGTSFTDSNARVGAVFKLDPGDGVNLPIELTVTPASIPIGSSATVTWASPSAAGCIASGAWTDTVGTQGSTVVTPAFAAIYIYVLACTDPAGVLRYAYSTLQVNAPPTEPVDGGGGGGGGGSLSLSLLLLLGVALSGKLFISRVRAS